MLLDIYATSLSSMTWEMQVSSGAWVDAPFKPPVRIEEGKKATFTFQNIPCTIEFKSTTEAVVTAKDKTYIARPKALQPLDAHEEQRKVSQKRVSQQAAAEQLKIIADMEHAEHEAKEERKSNRQSALGAMEAERASQVAEHGETVRKVPTMVSCVECGTPMAWGSDSTKCRECRQVADAVSTSVNYGTPMAWGSYSTTDPESGRQVADAVSTSIWQVGAALAAAEATTETLRQQVAAMQGHTAELQGYVKNLYSQRPQGQVRELVKKFEGETATQPAVAVPFTTELRDFVLLLEQTMAQHGARLQEASGCFKAAGEKTEWLYNVATTQDVTRTRRSSKTRRGAEHALLPLVLQRSLLVTHTGADASPSHW